MIGWQAQIGAHRRRTELAGWTAAGAFVLGTVAAGTALAMIYDPAGTDGTERAVILDLPPIPAAQAVAEVPATAPEVPVPDAPDLAPPEPEAETPPDLPAPLAEAPPDLTPPPSIAPPEPLADSLPDTTSPAPPPPVEQAAVSLPDSPRPPPRPAEEPEEEPEAPQPRRQARDQARDQARETPRQQAAERREAQPSQPSQAGARAASGTASANEIQRWTGRVQSQLARHMQRRRFAPGTVLLQLTIDASGRVTGASVLQARGAGGLEAEILAHARRIGRVTAPPPGAPNVLRVPVQVR